jgi:hypothetical protein
MTLHIRDLATNQPLTREAAAEIRGGKPKYGSPAAPLDPRAHPGIVVWNPGPSIEDAANAGDDSHYYGLPPLR